MTTTTKNKQIPNREHLSAHAPFFRKLIEEVLHHKEGLTKGNVGFRIQHRREASGIRAKRSFLVMIAQMC